MHKEGENKGGLAFTMTPGTSCKRGQTSEIFKKQNKERGKSKILSPQHHLKKHFFLQKQKPLCWLSALLHPDPPPPPCSSYTQTLNGQMGCV